jgi:hypothetical protein
MAIAASDSDDTSIESARVSSAPPPFSDNGFARLVLIVVWTADGRQSR